jgi:type IV secretory pathway VirB10-like protein
MSDLNGPPPESAPPPTAAANLKNGLTGSPQAKLKLMVAGIIVALIAGIFFLSTKKSEPKQDETKVSKVAVNEVNLEEDEPGAAAANPEVNSLIEQVESDRQKTAMTEGDTYVARVPDLDSTPPPRSPEPSAAPVMAPSTVSSYTQQAKLAALQGLDERLADSKLAVVTETQFVRPDKPSSTAETAGGTTSGGTATGGSAADQMPVKKTHTAGTVWYATTLNAIDSDVQGPIKARVDQGPFAGGEALGSYEIRGRKYVVMSFSKITFKGVEYPISAIGVNPNNGVAGIEGDVNNHWASRLVLPTLTAAVGKYAEAATFGGVTSITAGGSVIQQPELTTSEQLQYALGSGVQTGVTPVLQEEANSIKRQVTLPQNTSFGLMLAEGI